MGNRFEDLDRFLPPEPAPGERATEPDAPAASTRLRPRRSFPSLRRSIVRAAGLVVSIGMAVTAIGLIPTPVDPSAAPADANPRLDVAAGAGGDFRPPRQARVRTTIDPTNRSPRPRRVHRRVEIRTSPRSAARVTTPRTPAPATAPAARRARETKQAKPAPAPAKPAPPQTPLFDCVRTEGHEYYVTIDRARAGQMSSPGSGWRCSVLGQVYATAGEGRVPIELDDGTAYVLRRRSPTEPASELFALYLHWAGSDFFYSSRVADGGLVGYIAR